MQKDTNLIFVYNAGSSFFSTANDVVRKVIAPNSQECSLCRITYGPLSMKDEWRNFLESLSQRKIFLHKDEFHRLYPKKTGTELPAIFTDEKGEINLFISAQEINLAKTIADLINLINNKQTLKDV